MYPIRLLLAVAVLVVVAGCSQPSKLMPTPNLYASGEMDPFADVPPELRTNKVDVLYVTDRAPTQKTKDAMPTYGFGRSRSVAFGLSRVQFGEGTTWEELVNASRSSSRRVDLTMSVIYTEEVGRFPPTPRNLMPATTRAAATEDAEEESMEDRFRQVLADEMARTPVKEVYLFVHGYANDFDGSVETIGGLWHFFGRQGVPIAYSWPAGSGGLIRGYTYDRESSEFTVYHLKQTLRLIASCPEVKKVNILAHSRGTDVASTALRELNLEIGGGGGGNGHDRGGPARTREELKLGTVILAAPDMDVDVVIQRLVTARLGQLPERFAMYICKGDQALGISNWLFSGGGRLGKLSSGIFTPQELEALRRPNSAQIIDARVSKPGEYGHSYFHANPAVSSDVILVMRYHQPPGQNRPLRVDPKGFWYVDDNYPGPPKGSAPPPIEPVEPVQAKGN